MATKNHRRKLHRKTRRRGRSTRKRAPILTDPLKLKRINQIDDLVGPAIAQSILAGERSYRKLAKKYHVSFGKIKDIKVAILEEKKPQEPIAVALTADDLENTSGEKPNEILMAALYKIARFSGRLSETEATLYLRDVVQDLLPLATKYNAENTTGSPVRAIIAAVRKEARDQGWKEGYEYCSKNNHEQLGAQKYSEGFRQGRMEGEQTRDERTVEALRQKVNEEMKRRRYVPMGMAMNLRNRITWLERHLIRGCPSCGHVLTLEVCRPLMSLTDKQKAEIAALRKRKRRRTREYEDPDPYDENLPWFGGTKVDDLRKNDLADYG